MTEYERWIETCEKAGIRPLSDGTCYKLMAWLLADGGQVEVNYNTKLMADIRYAQRHLRISGGETPGAETRRRIAGHLREIESGHAEWLESLLEKYGISGGRK